MGSNSFNETYYLDVKKAHSPTDFIACIGKSDDYTNFEQFAIKLNNWADKQAGFNIDKIVNINCLIPNQSVLVNFIRDFENRDLKWKRSKIHSIDYHK